MFISQLTEIITKLLTDKCNDMKLSKLLDLLFGKSVESQQNEARKMIPVYVPVREQHYGRRR